MIVFHGSPEIVRKPSMKKCRPHNDYGPGFYCTLDKDLACEWSCKEPSRDGYCNEYKIDASKLTVLDLDQHPDGVLAWLAVLMEHRVFDAGWPNEHLKAKFVARYSPDLSSADLVCGYRADDSYFSIARAFLAGGLTDQQVAVTLRFGELGRQVMVRSPKAFRALRFMGAEWQSGAVWHPRWRERDTFARAAFAEMAASTDVAQGRHIYDFVEG